MIADSTEDNKIHVWWLIGPMRFSLFNLWCGMLWCCFPRLGGKSGSTECGLSCPELHAAQTETFRGEDKFGLFWALRLWRWDYHLNSGKHEESSKLASEVQAERYIFLMCGFRRLGCIKSLMSSVPSSLFKTNREKQTVFRDGVLF